MVTKQSKNGLPQAPGANQSRGQQTHAPQTHKSCLAQPETMTAVQMKNRPVAPPVYRPQDGAKAVQAKRAGDAQARKRPVAPPVYRPQPAPLALQRKPADQRPATAPPCAQPKRPAAPAVYRPQPVPKVLQRKTANTASAAPQTQRRATPVAPPVYRPNPQRRVLQASRGQHHASPRTVVQLKTFFYSYPHDRVLKSNRTEDGWRALNFVPVQTPRGVVWADPLNVTRVYEKFGMTPSLVPQQQSGVSNLDVRSVGVSNLSSSVPLTQWKPPTQVSKPVSSVPSLILSVNSNYSSGGSSIASPSSSAFNAPKLSDIEVDEWADALTKDKKLQQFPDFKAIWALIEKEKSIFEMDPKPIRHKIKALGKRLLQTNDIAEVRKNVNRMMNSDFTELAIEQVKKYNFASSSILFTAENYYSWINLARGTGTINDLRYIKHELYEMQKLSQMNLKFDVASHHHHHDEFGAAYQSAHHDALIDEMTFLAQKVKEIFDYPKSSDKPVDWKFVACSDLERSDEFLGALGVEMKFTPKNKLYEDEEIIDIGAVAQRFSQYEDGQLSGFLSAVKFK